MTTETIHVYIFFICLELLKKHEFIFDLSRGGGGAERVSNHLSLSSRIFCPAKCIIIIFVQTHWMLMFGCCAECWHIKLNLLNGLHLKLKFTPQTMSLRISFIMFSPLPLSSLSLKPSCVLVRSQFQMIHWSVCRTKCVEFYALIKLKKSTLASNRWLGSVCFVVLCLCLVCRWICAFRFWQTEALTNANAEYL